MPGFVPKVLFVCLGNICRSPTAEAVFRQKAAARGLNITIDSAGTHGFHEGHAPDKRSMAAGEARGYDFTGISCRKVVDKDFSEFDYILAMDAENLKNLRKMSEAIYHPKIRLFLEFAKTSEQEVPDPYYGGSKGFELVLDLIEEASEGLLNHIAP